MQGDKVIVRAYGDRPLVRRVWEVSSGAVFICSEENYKALVNGQEGLEPVGFPKEYVYKYTPKIDLGKRITWDSLNVYA